MRLELPVSTSLLVKLISRCFVIFNILDDEVNLVSQRRIFLMDLELYNQAYPIIKS